MTPFTMVECAISKVLMIWSVEIVLNALILKMTQLLQ